MSSKNWKGVERDVARSFGCERTPLSGGNSRHTRGDNCRHSSTKQSPLYIEVKSRESFAAVEWYLDARRKAVARHLHQPLRLEMVFDRGILWCIDIRDTPRLSSGGFCCAPLIIRANAAIISLFLATERLAQAESKTPVVALRKNNCQYTLLFFWPGDAAVLAAEFTGYKGQPC